MGVGPSKCNGTYLEVKNALDWLQADPLTAFNNLSLEYSLDIKLNIKTHSFCEALGNWRMEKTAKKVSKLGIFPAPLKTKEICPKERIKKALTPHFHLWV